MRDRVVEKRKKKRKIITKTRKKCVSSSNKFKNHIKTTNTIESPQDSSVQDDKQRYLSRGQLSQQRQQLRNDLDRVATTFFSSFEKETINLKKSQIASKLPELTVDDLLSDIFKPQGLNSQGTLDVFRYLKKLQKFSHKNQSRITIRKAGECIMVEQPFDRQQEDYEFRVSEISLMDAEILSKRSKLMEKIEKQHSKYIQKDQKLSQILKEMLFLLKLYRDCTQFVDKFLNQKLNRPDKEVSVHSQDPRKRYSEILVLKNLKNGFTVCPFNRLNYFRLKQIEQSLRHYWTQPLTHEQGLWQYLQKRKNRKSKGHRHFLPTACSCCFSDYYELSNPLKSCPNCNLRCHKLCFDFETSQCGNCSYQALHKDVKSLVPQCAICKRKGQMTVKIRQGLFCHAFCLLYHGLWSINGLNMGLGLNGEFLKKQSLNVENLSIISNWDNKQCHQNIEYAVLYKSPTVVESAFKRQKNISELKEEKVNLSGEIKAKNRCQVCKEQLIGDLYISCGKCAQPYHAFCAFFTGCYRTKQSDDPLENFQIFCCESQSLRGEQKKRREFILNQDRAIFMTPTDQERL